jgi:hypothetical protein
MRNCDRFAWEYALIPLKAKQTESLQLMDQTKAENPAENNYEQLELNSLRDLLLPEIIRIFSELILFDIVDK